MAIVTPLISVYITVSASLDLYVHRICDIAMICALRTIEVVFI